MAMSKRFPTWTAKLILFNGFLALFIILWGAWVRLSGSGAGCGEHWPLCHGQVIPIAPSLKTLIELTHRLTSGIFGLTVLAQWYFSFKEYGKKHPQFLASFAFLVVTIIEALIGAVLVKKGLVVDDTSAMRAWVIGAHLVNTLLLLGVLASCYCFIHTPLELKRQIMRPLEKWLALTGLVLFLIVGAFGAITALGNTLFPSTDLIQGLASDFDPNAPFLIRLRVYHPTMAGLLGAIWIGLLVSWREREELATLAQISLGLIFISLGFGVANWLMMAPTWGALTHLFLGDLLWMSICVTTINRFYFISKAPLIEAN